jgi:hypothetical protein
MTKPESKTEEVMTHCRGLYARVARKLNVDASLVSRVARGARNSKEIDAALRQELQSLKQVLVDYE